MKKSIFLSGLLCLFVGASAWGQTAVQIDTLRGAQQDGTVSGSNFGDYFGDHVAVDSDWLIVGAPREDVDLDGNGDTLAAGEADAGAIWIYARTASGPVLHQKIVGEGHNRGANAV